MVNKTNFLPKTVSTPTGTKMTFPSNVRIISVPSGSVAGSPGVVGNHASLAQKIMSSSVSGSGATAQVLYCFFLFITFYYIFLLNEAFDFVEERIRTRADQ